MMPRSTLLALQLLLAIITPYEDVPSLRMLMGAIATQPVIDVILAAQALSLGAAPSEMIIATTNARHLTQFVPARHWSEIVA